MSQVSTSAGVVGLGFHVAAQDGVDAGLVVFAVHGRERRSSALGKQTGTWETRKGLG